MREATILSFTFLLMACTTEFSSSNPDGDASTDTSTETGSDATPDAEPDTGPCEPVTLDGECNGIHQCGCPEGLICSTPLEDDCLRHEVCGDFERGEAGPEGICDTHADCSPGMWCTGYFCLEWCLEDADCSLPDRICGLVLTRDMGPPCGLVEHPYNSCSAGPCEVSVCEVMDPTSCPLDETCTVNQSCGTLHCVPSGDVDVFGTCGDGLNCMAGLGCFLIDEEGTMMCLQYCASDGECPGGFSCIPAGTVRHPEISVCA
ncbi:MAG: hypothetical protein JRG91_13540 [Deltaproteobacteria bacterium]|nr:hypothetical protein [Deltaproteobacteria bacterium]